MNDDQKIFKIYIIGIILSIVFLLLNTNTSALPNTPKDKDLLLTAPIIFDDSVNAQWLQLELNILKSDSKTINIVWGGFGGYTYIANRFIKTITVAQQQGKTINFIVVNNSYSMHAVVICYGNNYIMRDNVFLMWHNLAQVIDENKDIQLPNDPDAKRYFSQCVRKGILNPYEVARVRAGFELYKSTSNTWYKIDNR